MILQDPSGEPYEPFGFTPRQRREWDMGVDLHGEEAMIRNLPSRGDNTAGFGETMWAYTASDLWAGDLITDTLSGNASALVYGTNPTLKGIGKIANSLVSHPLGWIDPFSTVEEYQSSIDEAYFDAVHSVTRLFGDTPVEPMSVEEAFRAIPEELRDHPDTHAILRLANQVRKLESEGHRRAMVSSWLREAQNRNILERTPWYSALLAGLVMLPVDLSAWADYFMTGGLLKAGVLTRQVVGSSAKHYGKTIAAGMGTGAVSGSAREYLLWQGQELRTPEMGIQAVAVETVLGGFIGAGLEYLGHGYTRAVARRAGTEATGGAMSPLLPVPTAEDLAAAIPMPRSDIEDGFIESAYEQRGVGNLGGDTWMKDQYQRQLSRYKRDVLNDRLEAVGKPRIDDSPLEQAWEWAVLTREDWTLWDVKVRDMLARHIAEGVQFNRPLLDDGGQPVLPGMTDVFEVDGATRQAEADVFSALHAAEESIMLKRLDQLEEMAANHIANGLTMESMKTAWEAAGGTLDPDDPAYEGVRRLIENFTLERAAVVLNEGEVEFGDLLSVRGSSGKIVADQGSSDDPLTPEALTEYFREELGADSHAYQLLVPYLEHLGETGEHVSKRGVATLFSDAEGGMPLHVEASHTHHGHVDDWGPISADGKEVTVTIKPNLDHPLFDVEEGVLPGLSPLDQYRVESTTKYRFSRQQRVGRDGETSRVVILESVDYGDTAARRAFDSAETAAAVRSGARRDPGRARYRPPDTQKQLDKVSMRKALAHYLIEVRELDRLAERHWGDISLVNMGSSGVAQHASGEYDPHNMWAREFKYRRLETDEGPALDLTKEGNWKTGGSLSFSDVHEKYRGDISADARLVVEAKVHNNPNHEGFFGATPAEKVTIYLDSDGYVIGFLDADGKARVEHLGKHHQEVITETERGADPAGKTTSEINSMLGDQILLSPVEAEAAVARLREGRVSEPLTLKPRRVERFGEKKGGTGVVSHRAVLDREHLDTLFDEETIGADFNAADHTKITQGGHVEVAEADNNAWEAFHRLQARMNLLLGFHTGRRHTELRMLKWSDLKITKDGEGEIVSATLRIPQVEHKKSPERIQLAETLRFEGDQLHVIKKLERFRKLEKSRLDYFANKVSEEGQFPEGGKYYQTAKDIRDKHPDLTDVGGEDTLMVRPYQVGKRGAIPFGHPVEPSAANDTSLRPVESWWSNQRDIMNELLAETSGSGARGKAWRKHVKTGARGGTGANEALEITRRTILNLARNSVDPAVMDTEYFNTVVRLHTGHAEPVAMERSTFELAYKQNLILNQSGNPVPVEDTPYKQVPCVVQQIHNRQRNLAPPEYYEGVDSEALSLLASRGAGDGHDINAMRVRAKDELDELRTAYRSSGNKSNRKKYRESLDINIRMRIATVREAHIMSLKWSDVKFGHTRNGLRGDGDRQRGTMQVVKITYAPKQETVSGRPPRKETLETNDVELIAYLKEAKQLAQRQEVYTPDTQVLSNLTTNTRVRKYTSEMNKRAYGEGYEVDLNHSTAWMRGFRSGMPEDVLFAVDRPTQRSPQAKAFVGINEATDVDIGKFRGHAAEISLSHYTSTANLWTKVPIKPKPGGGERLQNSRWVMGEVRALHNAMWSMLQAKGISQPSIEDYLDLTLDVNNLKELLKDARLRDRYDRGHWDDLESPLVTDEAKPGYDPARISAVLVEVRRDILSMHHLRTMDDLVDRLKTVYAKRKGRVPETASPAKHYAKVGKRKNQLARYSSQVSDKLKKDFRSWHSSADLLEVAPEISTSKSRKLIHGKRVGDPDTRYDVDRTEESLDVPPPVGKEGTGYFGSGETRSNRERAPRPKEIKRSVQVGPRYVEGTEDSFTVGFDAKTFRADSHRIREVLIDRQDDLFSTRDGEVRALFRFRETLGDIIIALKNPNADDALEEVFHLIDVRLLKKSIPLEMRGGVTDEMIDTLDEFAGNRTSVEGRERLAKAFIDFATNNRAPDVETYTVFERLLRFIRQVFRIAETQPGQDMTGVMTPEVRAAFSQILQRNRMTSAPDIALRNAIANSVVDPNDPAQCANAALLLNADARRLRLSLEDRSEAGILLPREEQELLDIVLTGAPQEMIELFGARVGTIAGKIVRGIMFLSPGSRLLGSENPTAQYTALQITNTGILMSSGVRVGSSLDRQHSHLTMASLQLAEEYGKIARRNRKEGGVLTESEFDKVFPIAEQFLAPDEAIPKDFHIRTSDRGVQGSPDFVEGETVRVFDAAELTDTDIKNLEEARQMHRHALLQEDEFLDVTGARIRLKVDDLRKLYREAYNENLSKRVFDTGLVASRHDEVKERVMRGWWEFYDYMVGKDWDGNPNNPVETSPEGLKLKRINDEIAATQVQLQHAPDGSARDRRAKKRLEAKLSKLVDTDRNRQIAEMEALKPDPDKASGIVSQWGDPPLAVTDQSWLGVSTAPVSNHGDISRTILISDKWILPYLKHSGSEQAIQFARHHGIKGLSVGKLGRSDQKKYINNTKRLLEGAKEIEDRMLEIETQYRDPASPTTVEAALPELRQLQRDLEDVLDEINNSTDIQMIVTDAYLMPSESQALDDLTPDTLVSFVQEIEDLGRVRMDKIKQHRALARELEDDAGNLTEADINVKEAELATLNGDLKDNAKQINDLSAQIGNRGGQLDDLHISKRVRDHSGPDVEGSPYISRESTHGVSAGSQPQKSTRMLADFEGLDYLGPGAVRTNEHIHSMVARSAAVRKRGLNEIGNTVDVVNSLEHLAAGIHRDSAARHGGPGKTRADWEEGLKEKNHLTASVRIIHDRLHGNHNKVSKNSPPWLRHTLKNVRNLVYSMSMGAVVRSSVPDMASTAAVNGFGPSLVAFAKVANRHISNMTSRGRDDPELMGFDRIMSASEITMGNYRQAAMNNIDPHRPLHSVGETGKSKGERVTDATSALARATSTFSGITRWNGFWKEVNVLASMDHMIRMGHDLRNGVTPSDWDMRYIRRAGMTDGDLEKVSILADRFGRDDTTAFGGKFRWSGDHMWEASDGISSSEVSRLRSEFRSSMHTMADLAVISPDAGNVPGLSDSTDAGSMITQFKRFFMVATVNVSTPMMQRSFGGDPRVMAHMASMSTLGAMVYWWSSAARGVDPGPALMNPEEYSREQWWNNVAQLVYEATDRSGMLGIFSEFLNLSERLGVGPSVAFGGKGLSRSQSRPIGQIVLGPAVGKLEEAGIAFHNGIKALFTDEPVSPAALRSWNRLTPLNNILPFTSVVNQGVSMLGGAAARRRFIHDFGSRDVADQRDFYYANFRWAEHRLADMVGMDVDYSDWHPGRKVGL